MARTNSRIPKVNWSLFILAALATYRLALMGSSEEGPAAIFARLRRTVPAKTNPGRGMRCLWCWTVWVAGVITITLDLMGHIEAIYSLLYWPALSAVAIALHQTFTKS